ncbi:hypothetical protein BDV93DRAFT_609244 [Ceratobasidium sp. AG-I]|nr:hypothetical protein BDV93DRAFT_609244 [Ceratobasidium sp. AG-I]
MIMSGDEDFSTLRKLLAKTNKPSIDTGPRCEKKALLIGISYQSCDAQKCGHLKGAHGDVLRLAKILVKTQGYSLTNIRVLADGCEGAHTKAHKANILKGIKWLTEGCVPGDFRVFSFAGHGFDDVKLSEAKDHKVYDQNRAVTWTGEVSNDPLDSSARQIVYSREAIAPQDIDWLELEGGEPGSTYSRPVRGQREIGAVAGWQIDRDTLLYDKELNHAFSGLPQGSTLTCFMDCCHSGRMLSLPIKLGGGGHRQMKITIVPRGAPTSVVYTHQELEEELDINPEIAGLTSSLGSMLGLKHTVAPSLNTAENELLHDVDVRHQKTPADLKGHHAKGTKPVSAEQRGIMRSLFPGVTEPSPTASPLKSRERGLPSKSVSAAPQRPAWGPTTPSIHYIDELVDSKILPASERMTNKIKASVFCWTAGHQRQRAKEDDFNGFFTKGFCEALENRDWCTHIERGVSHQVTEPQTVKPTYRELLKQVSTQVYAYNQEQFVQLWSSLADGELDKEFTM